MRLTVLASMCLLLAFASARSAGPTEGLFYTLRYSAPGSATVHVRIGLVAFPAERVLVMPRAVPMGYGEQPYARFVSNVRALDSDGKALNIVREKEGRWRVGPAAWVEYDVDLKQMEQEIAAATDSSHVRPGYVSVLGYSVFGFLEGEGEKRGPELFIEGPPGWPVFSTLAPAGGPLVAEDFYALADSQILMGPEAHSAPVPYAREKDAPLTLAYYSEVPVDAARLARLSGEAMTAMQDYFDGSNPPPYAHYSVFLEFLQPLSKEHAYGFGMEHLESFHAAMSVADADTATFPDNRLRYHIAHHIAHAWIPKRCYGAGYYPFTWEAAPKIDTIWFSEGFAQYAAIVALAANENDLQRMLERRFRSVLREAAPELRRMPLRELSLRASTEYARDFRIGQLTFSRGGLMAAEMDGRIREQTHGQKSLRDALRALLAWSAQNHRAFRVEELPARFQEATGVATRDILERWLSPLD
jgi:predicted metalloprotease with PDZ domain